MNGRKRVLVVARDFWPTTKDDTLRLVYWIRALIQEGFQPTVLTTRPNKSWPARVIFDETPVERLLGFSTNPLWSRKYLRSLNQWWSKNHEQFDLIYCDDLGQEASHLLATVKSLDSQSTRSPSGNSLPMIVRADQRAFVNASGKPAELAMEICRKADAVIVPSVSVHRSLMAAGLVDTPVVRASDRGEAIDRSIVARRNAKRILREVNHDLFLRSNDRLIVCPTELFDAPGQAAGLEFMLRALGPVVERHQHLHLWIIGDGRDRIRIYDNLRHAGLHRVINMPGVFTDMETILQVADLCILPRLQEGLSWIAPTCVASNIPVWMVESPTARGFIRGLVSHASGSDPLGSLGNLCDRLLFSSTAADNLRAKTSEWHRDGASVEKDALYLQGQMLKRNDVGSGIQAALATTDAPSRLR